MAGKDYDKDVLYATLSADDLAFYLVQPAQLRRLSRPLFQRDRRDFRRAPDGLTYIVSLRPADRAELQAVADELGIALVFRPYRPMLGEVTAKAKLRTSVRQQLALAARADSKRKEPKEPKVGRRA